MFNTYPKKMINKNGLSLFIQTTLKFILNYNYEFNK